MKIGHWRKITLGIMFLLIGLSSSPAWSQVETYRSSSFGDSLTDNDSLYWLFGTDPAIYGADPFEAMFNKAAGTGDQLANYAILGSASADVLLQIQAYAAARDANAIERSTLVSIQAGGMGHRKQIAVLDISSVLTAAILMPPVIAGVPLVPPPYFGFSYAIFADPLHPTAVSNGITANMLITEANMTFDDSIPLYSEDELADMAGLSAAP